MSPRKPVTKLLTILLMLILVFSSGLHTVHSGSVAVRIITVNSFADIDDNAPNSVCSAGDPTDGPCTLRSAIYEANQNVAYEHIIIRLPAGEYNLTIPPNFSSTDPNDNHTGDLNIDSFAVVNTNTITIEPEGSDQVIIRSTIEDRVLSVDTNARVTISHIIMREGHAFIDSNNVNGGGAIVNKGILSLNDVSLLSNTVSCRNGTSCASSGGAIENWGNLTIQDSTLDGNTARQGSAIWHSGTTPSGNLTISYSTLSNNHSELSGTIINYSNLVVLNSTFSGNTSSNNTAAGINNSGTLSLRSTTFDNLGFYSSVLNQSGANASFIADNIFKTEAGGSNCSINASSTWTSRGYNIANDNSCDLDKTLGDGDLSSVDPQLGSFGNWGGPTKTYMLNPGSPALNHRPDKCWFTSNYLIDDQRHWARSDGKCDTGSFEFSPWYLYLPLATK